VATFILPLKSIYSCASGKDKNIIIQCLFSSPEGVWYSKYIKKLKFTIEQTMKVQRGSRVIALALGGGG
jgi:hypothetical protein